jgi:hypothetical protein
VHVLRLNQEPAAAPALPTLQRGAAQPQSQRVRKLLGVTGGAGRPQIQQQQQQQQGGAARQKQQGDPRLEPPLPLESPEAKCCICSIPPVPGKALKKVQVRRSAARAAGSPCTDNLLQDAVTYNARPVGPPTFTFTRTPSHPTHPPTPSAGAVQGQQAGGDKLLEVLRRKY